MSTKKKLIEKRTFCIISNSFEKPRKENVQQNEMTENRCENVQEDNLKNAKPIPRIMCSESYNKKHGESEKNDKKKSKYFIIRSNGPQEDNLPLKLKGCCSFARIPETNFECDKKDKKKVEQYVITSRGPQAENLPLKPKESSPFTRIPGTDFFKVDTSNIKVERDKNGDRFIRMCPDEISDSMFMHLAKPKEKTTCDYKNQKYSQQRDNDNKKKLSEKNSKIYEEKHLRVTNSMLLRYKKSHQKSCGSNVQDKNKYIGDGQHNSRVISKTDQDVTKYDSEMKTLLKREWAHKKKKSTCKKRVVEKPPPDRILHSHKCIKPFYWHTTYSLISKTEALLVEDNDDEEDEEDFEDQVQKSGKSFFGNMPPNLIAVPRKLWPYYDKNPNFVSYDINVKELRRYLRPYRYLRRRR